jgi:hypothetical protein
MDDEQIIQRGGDQSDVEEYAKSNGADLTEEDFMYEAIRQRIGEIIGEASMCWSETPKGVFNSDKAKELVDEVMCHIEYPLDHPDDEVSTGKSNSK